MIIATARLGRRFYGTWFTSIWIARVWKRHYYSFRSSSSPIQDNKAHTHTHRCRFIIVIIIIIILNARVVVLHGECIRRLRPRLCVGMFWPPGRGRIRIPTGQGWGSGDLYVLCSHHHHQQTYDYGRRVHTEERRGEGGMRLHLHTSHHTERGESPPPAAPRELKRKMSVRRADDTARRILAWQSSTYLSHAGPTTFKSRKIFLSFSRLFIYRNAVDAVDAVEGNKISKNDATQRDAKPFVYFKVQVLLLQLIFLLLKGQVVWLSWGCRTVVGCGRERDLLNWTRSLFKDISFRSRTSLRWIFTIRPGRSRHREFTWILELNIRFCYQTFWPAERWLCSSSHQAVIDRTVLSFSLFQCPDSRDEDTSFLFFFFLSDEGEE